MVKKVKDFLRCSPLNVIPLVITVLFSAAVFNIYVAKEDMDTLSKYRDEVEIRYKDQQWTEVETMIEMAHVASRQHSKFIASRIETDLLRNYPDLNELKSEFEDGKFSEDFHEILKDNLRISEGVPSSIYQPSYYTLVGLSDGIISIFSNEAAVTLNATSNSDLLKWDAYVKSFPNSKLATTAIDAVLDRKNQIIYWQDIPFGNSLDKNSVMNMNTLKAAFEKEGFKGLEHYSLVSPSYITDDGDIFNTADVSFMKANDNYKMVIIQRYNIADILSRFETDISSVENDKTYSLTFIESYTERRTLESLLLAFGLLMMSIMLAALYNSEKNREYRQNNHEELEGDREEELM